MTGKNSIDVHTHVYLPRYVQVLRERGVVPRIVKRGGEERLIILPDEDKEATTAAGRPLGSEYYDPARKIAFMDRHGIAKSVLSLANPWLEPFDVEQAAPLARQLNEDMESWCQDSGGRFAGFGVLPMRDPAGCVEVLHALAKLP